ncbi:unnamed protein product [Mytilus edulis]|uniref:Uncharacterized protein n=1 Tax=Mytilus edulis TaxID=6550 RepID=A0A8S3VBE3_MYTED|nr:unnamed protein product [Mytilus edulis]
MRQFKTPEEETYTSPSPQRYKWASSKHQKKKHIHHHRHKDTNEAVQNTKRRNIYITIATKIPMGQFKTPKEETYTSPSPQRYQWGSSKHQKKKHIHHHRHKDTNGPVQNTRRRNIFIIIDTKIPMRQFKTPKEETYTSPSPQRYKWASSKHQKKKHIHHHRHKDTNEAVQNTKRRNIYIPIATKIQKVQNTRRRNIYIIIDTKIPMGQFKTPKEETYTSPSPQRYKWASSKHQKKKHIHHHRHKDTNGAVQNTKRRNIYIPIATKIPMGQFKTPEEETYTSPSTQRYQ